MLKYSHMALLPFNLLTIITLLRLRRKWQPPPLFLPGKSYGWRSLADYIPWGCKELDMTEWLTYKHKQFRRFFKVRNKSCNIMERTWILKPIYGFDSLLHYLYLGFLSFIFLVNIMEFKYLIQNSELRSHV